MMKVPALAFNGALLLELTSTGAFGKVPTTKDGSIKKNTTSIGSVPVLSGAGLGYISSPGKEGVVSSENLDLLSTTTTGLQFIQFPNLTHTFESIERAEEVKEVFRGAYEDYRKYAFGFDQLLPNSLNGTQTRNGWGATIVDALDTLILMGFQDWYTEGINWIKTIDYTVSKVEDQTVSVFETTIRYLGGMLSAYSLSPSHEKVLVDKSIELGNSLSIAWSLGTDVPYGFLNLSKDRKTPVIDTSNIAEAGTLVLEFNELSRLSQNKTYRSLAEKSNRAIVEEPHPLPGLPAQGIDPTNGGPVGDYVTWTGGSDSYFEYLLKYALMTGNEDPIWITAWKEAVDTTISKLIRKDSVKGLTYPADYSKSEGGRLYLFSHLECFIGGNWMMGGRMLQNETIFNIGLELTETCYNSYNSTLTKLGPEGFCYIDSETGENRGCEISGADLKFYNQHGFAITAADYILRPEVLESYFYAYRLTGDSTWQDRAWEAFQALKKWTKAKAAYSGINNVNHIPPVQNDDDETFFYAELMKYYYLIFAEPELINLDRWVINTEAHPFPIQKFTKDFAPIERPTPSVPFVFNDGPLPAPSGDAALMVGKKARESSRSASNSSHSHHHRRRSHHGRREINF